METKSPVAEEAAVYVQAYVAMMRYKNAIYNSKLRDISADTLSAIDLGSLLSSSVDQPKNPQQTETFRVNDRTGDYRRDGNLRSETTFFSKASYFAVLVQF